MFLSLFPGSTGASAMCAINRIGIYILLSILINLSVLMFEMASALVSQDGHKNRVELNILSTTVPILLPILGYALEVDIDEGDNAKLNLARHAFSCSMRSVAYRNIPIRKMPLKCN